MDCKNSYSTIFRRQRRKCVAHLKESGSIEVRKVAEVFLWAREKIPEAIVLLWLIIHVRLAF